MPDMRTALDNLKAPLPLPRKLRLVAGNSLLKLRKPRGCCGHPGEPGC